MRSVLIPEIPADPEEQARKARLIGRSTPVTRQLIDKACKLAPGQRVGLIFPLGVKRGALHILRIVAMTGKRLPIGIHEGEAWATGLAAGLPLPPRAAFSERRREGVAAMYRAGVERGVLAALEAIGLRDKGGG